MSDPDDGTAVLELRVHGVRGTPTESMLGVGADDVQQVAGDQLTGFYRIADGGQPPLRKIPPTMALEAYSWGALTSGVRGVLGWISRVLWLLLLPFALVNLAFWARTQAGQDSGQARWGLRAVRISSLLLTVIAILTPCFVAIDLVGWQCFRANAVACPVLPDWLDPIAALSVGQRLALTSLVPLGALLMLVALSFQSLARYEAAGGDEPVPTLSDTQRNAPRDGLLEHPLMWQGEQRTRRLQRLHVVTALATVVLFTGIHVLVRGHEVRLWPTTAAAALLLLLVMARSLCIDELDLEYRSEPHFQAFGRQIVPWTGPGNALRWLSPTLLAWTALAVVVIHLAVLWTIELPADVQDAAWYGSNLWFITLFVALTILHVIVFVGGRARLWFTLVVAALLLLLAVVGGRILLAEDRDPRAAGWLALTAVVAWALLLGFHWNRARRAENRPAAWGGAGASVLLGAATMVALLFTSAASVAAANFLNSDQQSVADLITVRNERSPVSASGERRLTLAGDVVLDGARVVIENRAIRVTGGTIRTDALTRESDGMASYSMASTMVDQATLLLPPGTTTVRLVASCFGSASDPAYPADAACTGESTGFRTAGSLEVSHSLQVAAANGKVELAVTDPPQTPLVVPQVLVWTPLMQLLLLVLGGSAAAVLVWRFQRSAAGDIRRGVARRDAASARVSAALAHRAERLLDGVGTVTTALALVTLALSAGGRPPWALLEGLRPVATISLYVSLVACAGLIAVGAQVRKSSTARRNAGILWDVTTFWPRAAHPFAPPCYAERVVPEIKARVEWALAEHPSRCVVLSGHSQGSLICVAVANQLPGREHQLRLLTYGSQVRGIYGRVFPAAAGAKALGYVPTPGATRMDEAWPDVPDPQRATTATDPGTGLRHRLQAPDHWVNLFRRTDPLGYRVYSDQDGDLDVVTAEVRPADAGDPGSQVMTHGGYQNTPEYRAVIARWTGETVQEPATGPVDADPLPPP